MPERRLPGDIAVEETLDAMLDALDSADNYRRWIFELALPHLEAPVLEVGAGHGTFTTLLTQLGPVHAVEPSPPLARALTEQHRGDARVEITLGTVEDVPVVNRFASAVMFNVLEHVEDDAAALWAVHERLRPDGSLVLWTPAFDVLYSRFDALLGHHRRYRLRPLVELVTSCGYRVVDARYANAVGWLGWLVGARLLDRVPTSPAVISLFDRFVVPVQRRIEHAVHPPFGQSVFLVARRTSG